MWVLDHVSGSLRREFEVCSNVCYPADGLVIHLKYGCGAHSETGRQGDDREIPRSSGVIVDELEVEVDKAPAAAEGSAADGAAGGGSVGRVSADAQPAAADVPEADSPEDSATPEQVQAAEGASSVPEEPATAAEGTAPAAESQVSEAPEADSPQDEATGPDA